MKRARYGSGCVFKQGNKYGIQFYQRGIKKDKATGAPILDASGRTVPIRERVRQYGFDTRRNAQDRLDEVLPEVRRGKRIESSRPITVADLYHDLQEEKRVNPKKMRPRELPNRWAHLEPFFGAMNAVDVTSEDVKKYRARRKTEGAANATVNRELATLKRMFYLGMEATPRKVHEIPHIPMLEENNIRTNFIEHSDFLKLTAGASELWLRTLLELAMTYGWRRGSLLGLRVEDVNLERRTVRLEPGTTKNKGGVEVAMTAKVQELLRAAVAGKGKGGYVLTREPGHRKVKDFKDSWQRLCVAAGLGEWFCRSCQRSMAGQKCEQCGTRRKQWKYRGLICHDFRRSAAKALRYAGVPESVIMKTGGWLTASVFRRYLIDSDADQRAAMEQLERSRAELAARQAQQKQIDLQLAAAKPLAGKAQAAKVQ